MSRQHVTNIHKWGVNTIIKEHMSVNPIVWEPMPEEIDPFMDQMTIDGLFYSLKPQKVDRVNPYSLQKYKSVWSLLSSPQDFFQKLRFSPFGKEAFGSASNYAGFLFLNKDQPEYSIQAYQRSLKINPSDITAMKMLVRAYSEVLKMTGTPEKREYYLDQIQIFKRRINKTRPVKYPVFM
jgi:hypothetical protein